jgi:lipoyl-dependent peroxiredoxin
MARFERQATITWEGTAREGHGELRVGSNTLDLAVDLPGRVDPGSPATTSPEELLAAAHASCYAMALAATLSRHGAAVSRLHVSATIQAEFSQAGLVIQASHLRVLADGLTGLEHERFADAAREAESRCPVSNVIRGHIRIEVEAIA